MADLKKITKIKDSIITLSTLVEQAHRDTLKTDIVLHERLGAIKDYLNEVRDTIGEWEVASGRKVKQPIDVGIDTLGAVKNFLIDFNTDVDDTDITNEFQGIRGELRKLTDKLQGSDVFEDELEEKETPENEEALNKKLEEIFAEDIVG